MLVSPIVEARGTKIDEIAFQTRPSTTLVANSAPRSAQDEKFHCIDKKIRLNKRIYIT